MNRTQKIVGLLVLLLVGVARPVHAQAVISAPLAEQFSRDQIGHQTVTGTLMAQGKYLAGRMRDVSADIKGIVDQTKQLHDTWYSSLLQISNGVRTYRRVAEIYTEQSAMIGEFTSVLGELRRRNLTADQLAGATATLQSILAENVGLVGELASVLSANRAKMTDPERIEFINNIADRVRDQHNLMNYYTSKCRAVARLQEQAAQDRATVLSLLNGR